MTVAAPTLILTSGPSVRKPTFSVTGDIQVGDTMRLAYGTSATFVGATEVTNTIDSAEFAAASFSEVTPSLADGTWYFRIRTERPGPDISPWSNTQSVTIGAVSVITLSPSSLPPGTTGSAYSQQISATGGTGPYTFSFTGTLPNGLTLPSNGLLSGTPNTVGTFSFTVTAQDSLGATGPQGYSVTVSSGTIVDSGLVKLADRTLERGLSVLATEANALFIDMHEPLTYDAAVNTYVIGNKTGAVGSIFGAVAPATGGRKVTLNAITDGTVANGQIARYWSVVDTINQRLLASGPLVTPTQMTAGLPFQLNAFDITQPAS